MTTSRAELFFNNEIPTRGRRSMLVKPNTKNYALTCTFKVHRTMKWSEKVHTIFDVFNFAPHKNKWEKNITQTVSINHQKYQFGKKKKL